MYLNNYNPLKGNNKKRKEGKEEKENGSINYEIAEEVLLNKDLIKFILSFTKNNGFNWYDWIDGNSAIRNGHITLLREKKDLIFTTNNAWRAAIELGNIEVIEMLQNNPELENYTIYLYDVLVSIKSKNIKTIEWVIGKYIHSFDSFKKDGEEVARFLVQLNNIMITELVYRKFTSTLQIAKESIKINNILHLEWLKKIGFKFDLLLINFKDAIIKWAKEDNTLNYDTTIIFYIQEIFSNDINSDLYPYIIRNTIKAQNIKVLKFLVEKIYNNKIPIQYTDIIINSFKKDTSINIIDELEYLGFKVKISIGGLDSVIKGNENLIKIFYKKDFFIKNLINFSTYVCSYNLKLLDWFYDSIEILDYCKHCEDIIDLIILIDSKYGETFIGQDEKILTILHWFTKKYLNNQLLPTVNIQINSEIEKARNNIHLLFESGYSFFCYNYCISNITVNEINLDNFIKAYGNYKINPRELSTLKKRSLLRGNIGELKWFETQISFTYELSDIIHAINSNKVTTIIFIKDNLGVKFEYDENDIIVAIINNNVNMIKWLFNNIEYSKRSFREIFMEIIQNQIINKTLLNLKIQKCISKLALLYLEEPHNYNFLKYFTEKIIINSQINELKLFIKFIINIPFLSDPITKFIIIRNFLSLLFENKKFNLFLWTLSLYINREEFKSFQNSRKHGFITNTIIKEIYENGYVSIIRFMIENKLHPIENIIHLAIISLKLHRKGVFILLFDEYKLHEFDGFCKAKNMTFRFDEIGIDLYDAWFSSISNIFDLIKDLKKIDTSKISIMHKDNINDIIEYMEKKQKVFIGGQKNLNNANS